MLREFQIQDLKPMLRGPLITPDDADYDEARKVYNAMIDKRPWLIVQCRDAADVVAAVNFGRENGLTIAIRGGGHNGAGLGTCDNGLVIDLGKMRSVRVDPQSGTVRVQGGATWGDVDHATHAYGLAVPTGFLSTTGVGGLTLGGGVGYLTRRYGLTIDNLLGVDMVLADGSLVTANSRENPDLYWAVRGGGGNFGVVTSFLFQGRPVSTVYGGPIFWELEDAPGVMRYWRDLILSEPQDLNGWLGFHTVPPVDMFPKEHHLKKMIVITWCYTGDLDEGEQVFKPIRSVAKPAIDYAGPIPFPALNSIFDWVYPPGLQWYWNSDIFTDLSDKVVDVDIEYCSQLPSMHSTMHLYPINGAAHRVDKDDTAWYYRDGNFVQVIVGVDPDPINNPRNIKWAKDFWQAVHPYSSGGAYVNMMMEEGMERIKTVYGGNYPRLAEIKAKYDPRNLFHVNQNIKPA